ncbi:hypothetical protein OG321_35415 [Streptomyces sp. NBC_00424]|uniref:hypothetical protein n=1 Tax=Streptomyces sp. NBC_00424 TaxID=2903648 RepID=UPI00225A8335|nr:hypothetical protein [Streptomyces sp. NBC_00424]MCX5077760.1 hypothetical protein [Streptomyces sp. NBC_00424]
MSISFVPAPVRATARPHTYACRGTGAARCGYFSQNWGGWDSWGGRVASADRLRRTQMQVSNMVFSWSRSVSVMVSW